MACGVICDLQGPSKEQQQQTSTHELYERFYVLRTEGPLAVEEFQSKVSWSLRSCRCVLSCLATADEGGVCRVVAMNNVSFCSRGEVKKCRHES